MKIRNMQRFFSTFAFELRLRSLVNRASDSGSEGRAFESHRGHRKILDKLLVIKDFLFIYILGHPSICPYSARPISVVAIHIRQISHHRNCRSCQYMSLYLGRKGIWFG